MNRKFATWLIVLIVLVFLGYIIYDVAFDREKPEKRNQVADLQQQEDSWRVSATIDPAAGKVQSVGIMYDGHILIGGENFLACYDDLKNLLWTKKTEKAITSLCSSGDTVFASTRETILEYNINGDQLAEWGPFEDNAIITSVTANNSVVIFADAGNKVLMTLDRKGNFRKMIGKSGEPFVVPSPYFDVAVDKNNYIWVANTGQRRIEKRDPEGNLVAKFGEAGTAPEAFCGCCNPAHFAMIPQGFVTAEKGINRIKILDKNGVFKEFVSSINQFVPSSPLDIASADGKTIYAANQADSKIYVFTRKE